MKKIEKNERELLIARTLASAGINVSIQAVKIILGAIDLVDKKGSEITLAEINDMVTKYATEDMNEDAPADDK